MEKGTSFRKTYFLFLLVFSFEDCLPKIFSNLGDAHEKISSSGSRLFFRETVERILQLWEKWCIYPKEYLHKLKILFLKQKEEIIEQNSFYNLNSYFLLALSGNDNPIAPKQSFLFFSFITLFPFLSFFFFFF